MARAVVISPLLLLLLTTLSSAVLDDTVLGHKGSNFDDKMDPRKIGDEIKVFPKVTPWPSSYSGRLHEAAKSIVSLLDKAKSVVPWWLMYRTPLKLGERAGHRLIGHKQSGQTNSGCGGVFDVPKGAEAYPYLWLTVNCVLGALGNDYSGTAGVIGLVGGYVQMAYAVSADAAANAPAMPDGKDPYIIKVEGLFEERLDEDAVYDVYFHSYLNYGSLGARAQILKAKKGPFSPCMLRGSTGSYTYNGEGYDAAASPEGAPCPTKNCTFGGVWGGGGGAGQTTLYAASFFYDIAFQVRLVKVHEDEHTQSIIVRRFQLAARKICPLSMGEVKASFPKLREPEFICLDLLYQYTLLVEGFGVEPESVITLVETVKHDDDD